MDLFLRTPKDSNNALQVGQPQFFWGQGQNDLIVDTNGDFATVIDTNALVQNLAKILVTERGANTLTPMYGSNLESFIGQRMNIDYLRSQIKTELIDTLRIYQFINKDNPNLNEQVDTLDSLQINLEPSNSELDISFVVITVSGQAVGNLVNIGA